MRHVCTECKQAIADGAKTEWRDSGVWTACAGGPYSTKQEYHGAYELHRHTVCPVLRERWYIIYGDNHISPAWDARPSILPGERVIRVAEEYVAEQSVQVKQTWPS